MKPNEDRVIVLRVWGEEVLKKRCIGRFGSRKIIESRTSGTKAEFFLAVSGTAEQTAEKVRRSQTTAPQRLKPSLKRRLLRLGESRALSKQNSKLEVLHSP
jgi:hypothetical protein